MPWYASLLESGERVLWQGRPGRVPLLYRVHWLHLPPLLFAAVLGTVLAAMLLSAGTMLWPLALAFTLPFLYYGVWQYIHLHRLLGKTEYAVTNRRVLRLYGGRTDSLSFLPEAYPFGAVPPMYMTLNPDGSGTIILSADFLGHEHQRDVSLHRVLPLQEQFRLDCIPQAGSVWRLIRHAQECSLPPPHEEEAL